ncbi:MAG: class I SAM-dependent methyltransferase [Thermoanaerobaculales bacterium]
MSSAPHSPPRQPDGPSTNLTAYYDMAREGHFWIEWRFKVFLNLIESLGIPLASPRYGLDVGCGSGVVRRQILRHSSWRLDGVDIGEEAIRRCAQDDGSVWRYDVRECRSDLEARYDLAILFDVLEHVAQPTAFLAAVAHHLKPGGWLFLNVPALPWLFGSYDRAQGHYRRYTRVAFRDDLPSDTFILQSMRYWGFSLVALAAGRKLLPDSHRSPEEILVRGFEPPGRLLHRLLLAAMRVETACLQSPPLGTSLMIAAMRR